MRKNNFKKKCNVIRKKEFKEIKRKKKLNRNKPS
jgi:hypothetical protein